MGNKQIINVNAESGGINRVKSVFNINESGISADDFDGIASLPMQFEGVEIAVTVREKDPGRFKISVRTGTDANASRICSGFGGGGHIRAAGCTITGELDDVKAQLLKACTEELHNVGY